VSGESAWELFQSGQEPSDVRQEVLTSWRRSQMSGVDPEHVDVPYLETNLDSQFSRVAIPIMTGMAELLVGDSSCLALSDATGSVIWRWVSEPMLRNTLDDLLVVEGFNFGEESVGTNGLGTALEIGALVSVSGSEHYVHRFHHVTCVAAPVRHPITRRTVGAVNVTCRASESNFLLRTVVRKLVDELQKALHDRATSRERQLLSAFLDEQRRAAGPLAVIGDGLIITNPQAADLGSSGPLGRSPSPAQRRRKEPTEPAGRARGRGQAGRRQQQPGRSRRQGHRTDRDPAVRRPSPSSQPAFGR